MRNLRGAQRFLGLFFLLVYSDADWLGRQTPMTWSGTDAKWVNVKVKVKMGTRDVCTGCCRSVRHLVFLKLLAFSMAHTPLFLGVFFRYVRFTPAPDTTKFMPCALSSISHGPSVLASRWLLGDSCYSHIPCPFFL